VARNGTLKREPQRGCALDAIGPIRDHGGMTKVDEKAHVPSVDAAARERLREALDREGVVSAMLIGSQARGNPGPLSDVDIAYWHKPALSDDERWDLRSALIGAAEEVLHTSEVDLVPLNDAPPLVQQRSIRGAVPLVERDRDERVRLETRAMLDYFDTQPLRDALRQGLRRRIEEGRFGRR
jgi:predicted nucleotidyltransferase